MNIANQITLWRLGAALILPFFLMLPVPFGKTAALVLFGLAAMTDGIDGALARRRNIISEFGRLMDPLADKVLICSAFVCFAAQDQIVPAWIVVVIMAREFMVTGIRLLAARQGVVVSAGRWGKHKTVWQIVVIIVVMAGEALREDLLPLLLAPQNLGLFLEEFNAYFISLSYWISAMVAVLTIVSGSIYFWQCRKLVMKDA